MGSAHIILDSWDKSFPTLPILLKSVTHTSVCSLVRHFSQIFIFMWSIFVHLSLKVILYLSCNNFFKRAICYTNLEMVRLFTKRIDSKIEKSLNKLIPSPLEILGGLNKIERSNVTWKHWFHISKKILIISIFHISVYICAF